MEVKKRKIEQIISLMADLNVSAYKIAKNTSLTEAGIGKIINGKSKNPNETSLKEILNYLLSLKDEVTIERRKGMAKSVTTDHQEKKSYRENENKGEEITELKNELLEIMRENRRLREEIDILKNNKTNFHNPD